ncbi:MAG: (5-formylfuran-3-yl)methyl phosphate synthase [Candidatus Thorarchaeota archaeon]
MKVLISIRSFEELVPAIEGGADIIDLKNPYEGSLGAPFPWLIKKIRAHGNNFPLSVAIGDMPNLPGTAALASTGATICGVDIIKVGLYGPRTFNEGVKLLKSVVKATKDINQDVLVVGAGYADFKSFNGIDSIDIPTICNLAGADIAMLDTYSKNGQKLFNFIDSEKLSKFINKTHENDLLAALAGSLELQDIKKINELGTDIIGFRGAACSGSDRKNGIVEINRVKKIVEFSQNLTKNARILRSTSII